MKESLYVFYTMRYNLAKKKHTHYRVIKAKKGRTKGIILQHCKKSKKLYCLYQELAGYRQESASSIIPESPGKVPDGKAEEKKADYTETQTTNIYTTLVQIAGYNSNKLYTYKKINLIYITFLFLDNLF